MDCNRNFSKSPTTLNSLTNISGELNQLSEPQSRPLHCMCSLSLFHRQWCHNNPLLKKKWENEIVQLWRRCYMVHLIGAPNHLHNKAKGRVFPPSQESQKHNWTVADFFPCHRPTVWTYILFLWSILLNTAMHLLHFSSRLSCAFKKDRLC